jgi:hypothetical protein
MIWIMINHRQVISKFRYEYNQSVDSAFYQWQYYGYMVKLTFRNLASYI